MPEDKRNFLRRALLGLSAGAATVATLGNSALAQSAGSDWRPAMEPQDQWLDQIGGRHRLVFDTISQDGVARALTFCATFYNANKSDYGIAASDLGVLMILRAGSTAFGFNDAFWSKYSQGLAERYTDPTTKAPPVVNIYNSAEKAPLLPTNALTFDALAKMGGRFAVCSVASHRLAATLAAKSGETAEATFAFMSANMAPGARLAPAGIVALNRAQEHHFSLCYTA